MGKLVLLQVVLLHYLWGVLLLLDSSTANVTAIAFLSRFTFENHSLEAAIYLAVATLSALGLAQQEDRVLHPSDILCMAPQQIVVLISGISASIAICESAFADGVVRPRAFIAADQSPAILIAAFHSWAIWLHFRRRT